MKLRSRLAVLPLLCAVAAAQGNAPNPDKTIGEVFASDATLTGSLVLVGGGMQVTSGSSVNAGKDPAVLRLNRGGEVRVCSATKVALHSSATGRDLLLSLNSGAVEVHYALPASSDSIMTPDFRVQLTGPGDFHFAIGADERGNTCVKTLARNSAALIVSEMMGGGTYQVKPRESVFFSGGRLAEAKAELPGECGCPAMEMPATLKAGVEHPDAQPDPNQATQALPQMPVLQPGEVKVAVEAPFVFQADVTEVPAAPQVVRASVSSLPGSTIIIPLRPPEPPVALGQAAVPQEDKPKKKKRGFFGRVGSFFAAMFGGTPR